MKNNLVIGIIIILVLAVAGFFLLGNNSSEAEVNDFDDALKLDGVVLMQHESEGFYGCFGCGNTVCIDPIQEMKSVSETEERYCNSDFEVVENGTVVQKFN